MSREKRLVPFIHAPKEAKNDTLLAKTIQRNDPCPCGSKKKVKNCHPELMKKYYYLPKEEQPKEEEQCEQSAK